MISAYGNIKNIFVSYEIAKNLKEIGFDEPCIAYRTHDGVGLCAHTVVDLMVDENTQYFDPVGGLNSIERDIVQIPTYEQVFSWFRSNHIDGNIVNNFGYYTGKIDSLKTLEIFNTCSSNGFEFIRDVTINKMIEIYKKQQ